MHETIKWNVNEVNSELRRLSVLEARHIHCGTWLIGSLCLMFRSMLEDLQLMLDPHGTNVEVMRQTFHTAMRTWAKKMKNTTISW
jgi:hypothetical protein